MKVIYREKDGSIQAVISYKVGGKWKQKAKQGFKNRKQAEKWVRAVSPEIALIEETTLSDYSITMSLNEYLDTFIEHKRLENISSGTFDGYLKAIDKLRESSFANVALMDIKKPDMKMYFHDLREKTGHSYKAYHNRVKAIFNYGKELDMNFKNPAEFKFDDIATDNRVKYISEELYDKIIKRTTYYRQRVLLRVLYETGLRISEAIGITIFAVKPNELIVDKQFYKGAFCQLKTKGSYRSVPISHDLSEELSNQELFPDGRIFDEKDKQNVQNLLQKFNTSPHCFRHTFITKLVHELDDMKLVSAISGDNIKTVMNTYLEINKDKEEEQRAKVAQMFVS